MSYTIELQPGGIRLIMDEPTLLLDAIRQAGIAIRADCGGKGICGKCRVNILDNDLDFPPTAIELTSLSQTQINEGLRLACETVVNREIRVYIPDTSITANQVLQVEGIAGEVEPNPTVEQHTIEVSAPSLEDLASDAERVTSALDQPGMEFRLDAARQLPTILRKNGWACSVLSRPKEIFHISPSAYDPLLGLAVDVGSTKLACYLVDLNRGQTLAAKGIPNPQIGFGEDIMARLSFALEKEINRRKLHQMLIQSINETAGNLTREIGAQPEDIADFCLVGNTAMHHFLLDLPPEPLAYSPFAPVLSNAQYPYAELLGLLGMPGSRVYFPEVIAGFVGADHLAFLLSSGFSKDARVRLGIDIGTNTEICLQAGDRLMSVSTASGPAFEGAHIRYGMRAAPGAIEHVTFHADGSLDLEIIGGANPVGICGSGILDALSGMREAGILNKRGRLDKSVKGVQQDDDGVSFFDLSNEEKPVTLSQKDIDQVLLAKGAIRAGIDVLMDALKIKPGQIDEVVIAGAFGSFMDPRHAIGIGMLPPIDLTRIHAVGNAAGTGARMMLISREAREMAGRIAQKVEYLELTVYPDFPLFYAHGIQA